MLVDGHEHLALNVVSYGGIALDVTHTAEEASFEALELFDGAVCSERHV